MSQFVNLPSATILSDSVICPLHISHHRFVNFINISRRLLFRMDNYNHTMQSEYTNIVYTTQSIPTIEGILPSNPAAKSDEQLAAESNSLITTVSDVVTEQIIDNFGAPAAVLVPVVDASDDLQPLQSSELQPLDSILVPTAVPAPLALNPVDAVDGGVISHAIAVPNDEPADIIADCVVPSDVTNESTSNDNVLAADAEIVQTNPGEAIEGEAETNNEDAEDVEMKRDEETVDAEPELNEAPELVEGATPADELKKEEDIDQNQCRICMSKENLVNIFKFDHAKNLRICDIIMILCSPLKIAERDFLPHFVCSPCVDKVNAAHDLKLLVEQTDKELRSKLKRSKKKRRGPTEFVIIDCAEFSSESDDDQNKDDDDFQLSELSAGSDDDDDDDIDSDVSFEEKPKRRAPKPKTKAARKTPKVKAGRTPAKRKAGDFQLTPIKRTRNDIVYIEAPADSDDESLGSRARGRAKGKAGQKSYSANAVLEKSLSCPICKKPFKQQASLAAHIEKHKEDDERTCAQCHQHFASKNEMRRHMMNVHTETFSCNRCKRLFTTKVRLDRHKEKCVNEIASGKRRPDLDSSMSSGKDLFKSVAPMTTTYWSDSFSD